MSEALPLGPGPAADDPAAVGERLQRGALREHALQSLLELGRELTVGLDPFETSDLLLFNLMGQLGTARAALWLTPEEPGPAAVLVRAHGFHRSLLGGLGTACDGLLRARFATPARPLLAWALANELPSEAFALVRHAGIALFAPLGARGELLGWLALGERVGGAAYGEDELQLIESALGMVAVSLHNARLYNRARETNRQLRAGNERLQELDRMKTEFLSNVNHELRTPLAVVMATLECVVQIEGGDPRSRGLLESSLAQSRKLNGLIENLLTLSEMQSQQFSLQLEPSDVTSLLAECLADRQPGVTAALRELALSPPLVIPPARFDRLRTRQILDELIDNAVKFTPGGTHITLGAVHAHVDGRDWVRIHVGDDGPGIPPERLERLFASFEQADGSATRTVGGLGIGLAFARALAERMDGRLTAESTLGTGTTFRIWLPVA